MIWRSSRSRSGICLCTAQDDHDGLPPLPRRVEAIASADAVLFVTPEYNRRSPVGSERDRLGSRPWGRSSPHPAAGIGALGRRDRHGRRAASLRGVAERLQRAADDGAGGVHPARLPRLHRRSHGSPGIATFLRDYRSRAASTSNAGSAVLPHTSTGERSLDVMTLTKARTAAEVVDWRRRVFALYDAVRRAESPEEAHELWRIERDELMLHHPATPLLSEDRPLFEGLPIALVRPAVALRAADPAGRARRLRLRDRHRRRRAVRADRQGRDPGCRYARRLAPDDLRRRTVHPGARRARRPPRRHLRRRPLSDRHDQGRRPRIGCRARHDRARLQLRLQPVVRLRPGVGLPARPARQRARRSRCRSARCTPARRADARPAAASVTSAVTSARVLLTLPSVARTGVPR